MLRLKKIFKMIFQIFLRSEFFNKKKFPNKRAKNTAGFAKILAYATIALCLSISSKLMAAENISEKYLEDLKEIESYLNNIKTLTANFTQQTSSNGSVKGKFYLSRPGKMRIEYINQPQIIIAVNGAILSYYDIELDEISRLSTNSTPASLLTRPNISFDAKDVEVKNISKKNGQIRISLMKKNRKEAGEFSLIFEMKPLKFIKMEVKNDLDQIIEVTLADIELGKPISDSIFVLKKSGN